MFGTDVISRCQDPEEDNDMPEEWKTAFVALQNGLVGYVKSTNDRTIEVQPLQNIIGATAES